MEKKKHTIYAAKTLNVEGNEIKEGTEIGTIETEIPLERLVGSLMNGSGTLTKPEEKPAPKPQAQKAKPSRGGEPIIDRSKVE